GPQVTRGAASDRRVKQPHVEAVAAVSTLPRTAGSARTQTIVIENRPPVASSEYPTANYQAVTPGYFRAMGIRLLKGRTFTEADALEAPAVVIINETMARRYFQNDDPIGKRLAMGGKNPGQPVLNRSGQPSWSEIVGMVADVKKLNMNAETVPDVFVPYWQYPMQTPALVIRTDGEDSTIGNATRAVLKEVNPNLPAPVIQTMDDILSDSVAGPRVQTLLITMFVAIADVLAA